VRTGHATTQLKNTGQPAAAHLRKLEEDSEHFAHATIDRSLAQALQQARLAKKMTQKDLAQLIMEKPTVVNEFESGRAMPNPAIIQKLERALGVRLPRPPKK
jgi:putative transcription factor